MQACTLCRKSGHNRKTCPRPRYPGKYWRHGRWRDPNYAREQRYAGLDDYILQHVGRIPVKTSDLYRRVVDSYGSVGERAFLRHLQALRKARRIGFSVRPNFQGFEYFALRG
jgi:hypothetical protein